jgi:hypothetical protein
MSQGETIIDDWIAEAEARGEARGLARGEARVEEKVVRRIAFLMLRKRFGEVPDSIIRQVEALGVEECEDLAERLLDEVTLEQLFPD